MDRQMIDYLPDVIRDIREYKAILNTEQPEFEEGWNQADYALQESIIMTATDYGLSRWESILGIAPKASDTLDDRRFRIITTQLANTPYTYRRLIELLTELCGEGEFVVTLDHENYSIVVELGLAVISKFEAVEELLKKILPANLDLLLSLKYNRHSNLSKYTHEQLSAYTYDEIRNKEELRDG